MIFGRTAQLPQDWEFFLFSYWDWDFGLFQCWELGSEPPPRSALLQSLHFASHVMSAHLWAKSDVNDPCLSNMGPFGQDMFQ